MIENNLTETTLMSKEARNFFVRCYLVAVNKSTIRRKKEEIVSFVSFDLMFAIFPQNVF